MDLKTTADLAPTAVASALYILVITLFAWSSRQRRPARTGPLPRVTILKPIAGADDELSGNLESFARLDYPDFELLIGIADRNDPAVPVVTRFLAAHPRLRAELCFTDRRRALNPKVAQLLELTGRARGDVLVVSDANVRVGPGYLRSLVGRLLRPGVGLVSSVVRGTGERSLGALVENAQLGAYVAPVVVASAALTGRAITVGKSMAMRRVDLERVGGWRSVSDVLAEDDVLGRRFDAEGYAVEVCTEAIDNTNVSGTLASSVDRHTRWAKMRRAIAPGCFALEPLLNPLAVATLVLVLVRSRAAFLGWTGALALHFAGASLVHGILRGAPGWRLVAVEPLRAYMAFGCWLRAWTDRRVVWRGNGFRLGPGSVLLPSRAAERDAEPAPAARRDLRTAA